jgi:hypothetical protein
MIFRRILHALRAQDWTAIIIELIIVVVGVFVGSAVASWNEKRLEKQETERLLAQLQPELRDFIEFFDSARHYYSITRSYADRAFAGWEGPKSDSDDQFVIAAYQATQVYGFPNNGENWGLIFGAQQLRNIEDLSVRRGLARVMTANYADLDYRAVATPYREHVRQIVPVEVQEAIRRACGDRTHPGKLAFLSLPRTCNLRISAEQAAPIAARLRARPELSDELRWHLAEVATFMSNMDRLEVNVRDLSARIDAND